MRSWSKPNKPNYSSHAIWYRNDRLSANCSEAKPKFSVVQKSGPQVEISNTQRRSEDEDTDDDWDDDDW